MRGVPLSTFLNVNSQNNIVFSSSNLLEIFRVSNLIIKFFETVFFFIWKVIALSILQKSWENSKLIKCWRFKIFVSLSLLIPLRHFVWVFPAWLPGSALETSGHTSIRPVHSSVMCTVSGPMRSAVWSLQPSGKPDSRTILSVIYGWTLIHSKSVEVLD